MVKQVKPLVILLLVLGASHAPGARGATLYVEQWGGNNGHCGSRINPCRTIQYTVSHRARAHDRVLVGPGTYRENIRIDTNLAGERLEGLRLESVLGRRATEIRAASSHEPVISVFQPAVRVGQDRHGFSTSGFTALHAGAAVSEGREFPAGRFDFGS